MPLASTCHRASSRRNRAPVWKTWPWPSKATTRQPPAMKSKMGSACPAVPPNRCAVQPAASPRLPARTCARPGTHKIATVPHRLLPPESAINQTLPRYNPPPVTLAKPQMRISTVVSNGACVCSRYLPQSFGSAKPNPVLLQSAGEVHGDVWLSRMRSLVLP